VVEQTDEDRSCDGKIFESRKFHILIWFTRGQSI